MSCWYIKCFQIYFDPRHQGRVKHATSFPQDSWLMNTAAARAVQAAHELIEKVSSDLRQEDRRNQMLVGSYDNMWKWNEMKWNEWWCRSLGRLAPSSCVPCYTSLFLSSYNLRDVYDVQLCCNAACGCLLLPWTLKMRPNLTRKETSTKTQQLVQPLTSHHLFLDRVFGYYVGWSYNISLHFSHQSDARFHLEVFQMRRVNQ